MQVAGRRLFLTTGDLDELALRVDAVHVWSLRIPQPGTEGPAIAVGDDATRRLGRFLSYMDDVGGSAQQVQSAVAKIEYFGGGARLLEFMAHRNQEKRQPLLAGNQCVRSRLGAPMGIGVRSDEGRPGVRSA